MDDAPIQRFAIVNADDFGLTSGINRGIIEAHERGVVTSASLMVRYPAAADAAAYARDQVGLSVGLHLDLGEWRYQEGEWRRAYQVVDASDHRAVEAEIDRQLNQFERLMQRPPTHLDSHQHVHMSEPVRSIMLGAAERFDVPLRACTAGIRYVGEFYGQTGEGEPFPDGITGARLLSLIDALQPGWTELGCHPGWSEGLDSVYLREREEELRVLCDREMREAIGRAGVHLGSFHEYKHKAPAFRPAP